MTDADVSWPRRIWRRRKARKVAKKRRLAAMSRKRRVGRRIGILATWFLAGLALILVTSVTLFYTLSNVPRPEDLALPQSATILYSDGSVMARIGSVNRTLVTLDQVPVQVRWDFIAAEDRNFYTESGVSIRGSLRAALSDLTGGDTEGGSSITQQYAKNAYLSDARTLTRKLKEIAIAVKLDRDYSKDQILEFYLNTVYFGRGAYGIQAAAQLYFHEDVSKLSVAQGAVLAALLRAPSYYDPAINPGPAKGRWQYVLDGMVTIKRITQAQEDAMTYPKVVAPENGNGLGASGPAALIVQQVIADLQAHGISEDEIYARGLTIRTTIDRKAQAAAVSAVDTTFAHLTKKQQNLKNALVVVDPSTGGVLAYYGGPDGTDYAGRPDYYDYAGLGFAAPGSSFKPYVLATALSQTLQKKAKIAINTKVDGRYCVSIQGTKICNDPGDQGVSSSSISVAKAMKYSLNTAFDLMASNVGPANVAKTAHAAGISKTINGAPSLADSDGTTSFGIGIGDYPVHPIDQAVGYATFADGGVAHPSYFVQSATDSNGVLVYRHSDTSSRAFDAKVANDVTLTLEPIAGYSGFALADGRVSAAKTGTEGIQGDKAGNNSDAWTVGYTPQVSAAVWVGSGNATTPIYNANGQPEYGRDLPGTTWKLFMDTYLKGTKQQPLATTQMIKLNPPKKPAAPSTVAPPSPTPTPTPTPTPSPTVHTSPHPSPSTSTGPPTPTASCGGVLTVLCPSGGASGPGG